MQTLTANIDDYYKTPSRGLLLKGGPRSGRHLDSTSVYPIAGMAAVWSEHSCGIYWLPETPRREGATGRLVAVWQAHPDARFPWQREVRQGR